MKNGDKLRIARKARGLTQKELADKLGVRQSVISDLETGQLHSWNIHAKRLVESLAQPQDYFGAYLETDQPVFSDALADMPPVVQVPEYDVRLSAGGGFIVDEETTRRTWPLPRFLVVDTLGIAPGGATIQEVIGDSMEPTLSSGDYVLIDFKDQRIGLPGIFAVWDGDALVCKRLERIPGADPSEVRIKSDNPLHGEYRVLEERVNVVGRVRWVTRRM
jgi:phage repressor protein C with HTH and peptisase S24 domain